MRDGAHTDRSLVCRDLHLCGNETNLRRGEKPGSIVRGSRGTNRTSVRCCGRLGKRRWSALLLLAFLTGEPSVASPLRTSVEATGVAPLHSGASFVLHDQFDAASGNGTPDQNFETALDAFDASAADDFLVPADVVWVVREIHTIGTTGLSGGAQVSVSIRANAVGTGNPDLPGAPLPGCTHDRLAPTTDTAGSFVISLPTPCLVPSGRFWVEVQTHQSAGTHGQHFWSNRSVRSGSEAAWRNPANGFGTGCTEFRPQTQCDVGGGASPDLLFRIVGDLAGADLAVSIADSPDPVVAGETIGLDIQVRNLGPAPAQGLELGAALPQGGQLTGAQASDGGQCERIDDRVTCVWVSALAPDSTRLVRLEVQTSPSSAAGTTLLTAAQAHAMTRDPDPANNAATAQTAATTAADLQLTAAPPPLGTAGETVQIVALSHNAGPSDAQDTELSFSLPSAAQAVSAEGLGGVCSIGATVACRWFGGTPPGVARRASLLVRLEASAADPIIVPIMTRASTFDPQVADNDATVTIPVQARANLALEVASGPDSVNAGNTWTFAAELSNEGPSDAQDARIRLQVPEGATVESMVPGSGGHCTNAPSFECLWSGSTRPGSVRRVETRLRVRPSVAPLTTLVAPVHGISATADDDPTNNSGTAQTRVTAAADLRLALASLPSVLSVGEVSETVATLENLGPSDAQGAELSFTLRSDLRFSGIETANGHCETPEVGQGGLIHCQWPGPMDALAVRQVRLRAYGGSPGAARLEAIAMATTPDPLLGNNEAFVQFAVGESAEAIPGIGPLAMLVLSVGLLFIASRTRMS